VGAKSQTVHELKAKTAGKLRVLIVDDEPLAHSNISALLRRDEQVEILGACDSGEQAIREIRRTRPDIVFLDVEMPECDGFDVLEMLGNEQPPAVVFVTAYDHYALRAFEAGALDYLVKPFDNSRFEKALGRAKEQIARHADSPRKLEQFVVKSAGKVDFVRIDEIDWIEAADYYSCLHVGRRSYLLRRSLNDLAQELDPSLFCRAHRSAIVRLARVRSLALNRNGEYEVVLDGDARIRVSRRYRKELQTKLKLRLSATDAI
jgi:two-component system, LytTR family, response regulator